MAGRWSCGTGSSGHPLPGGTGEAKSRPVSGCGSGVVQGDVVQDSGGPLVPLCDPVLPVSAAWVPEPLSP